MEVLCSNVGRSDFFVMKFSSSSSWWMVVATLSEITTVRRCVLRSELAAVVLMLS